TIRIGEVVSSTSVLAMSAGCFDTLGVRVQLGRPFSVADDNSAAPRVALLTDGLWRSAYGGRGDVLGGRIAVQGTTFTIIGVTDRRFSGLVVGFPSGLLIPLLQMGVDLPPGTRRDYFWASIFARRAPGFTQDQVAARIRLIQQQLLEQAVPPRYNQAQRADFFARRIAATSGKTGADWNLRRRYGDS